MRNYKDNVIRVLSAYGVLMPGPGLVPALETLCQTAEENGRRDAINTAAADVCEGLHTSEPRGLKCLSCYHAEHNYAATEQVEAEIAAAKAHGKKD